MMVFIKENVVQKCSSDLNSFGPNDGHYAQLCWLNINEVLQRSPEVTLAGNAQDIYPIYEFENY